MLPPTSNADSSSSDGAEWLDVEEGEEAKGEGEAKEENVKSRPGSKKSQASARSRRSSRNKSAKSSMYKMSALEFVAQGTSGYQQQSSYTLTEKRQQREQRLSAGSQWMVVSRKASTLSSSSSRYSSRHRRSFWKSWHRVTSCSSSVCVSNPLPMMIVTEEENVMLPSLLLLTVCL